MLVDRQSGVGPWFLACAIRPLNEGLGFSRQSYTRRLMHQLEGSIVP
jgi:hypothetical protein